MRRTTILIALSTTVTLALLLAACTTTSDDSDDIDVDDDATPMVTEIPAETEVPDETPETDEEPDATPGTDEEPDPVSDLEELEQDVPIMPEPFYLTSSAGEQEGWARNYFWSDAAENVAMEIEGYYVPLPDEPLEVEPGETLTLEWERDDIDPEEITITVYPREGNFEESVGTRDGESDAFFPNTEEVLTETVDAADPIWAADLDEGEHFVLIDTLWPSPEEWPKDRQAEFGFWIVVE